MILRKDTYKHPKWFKSYPFGLLLIPLIIGILLQEYLCIFNHSMYWVIAFFINFFLAALFHKIKSLLPTIKVLRTFFFHLTFVSIGGFVQHESNIKNSSHWYGHSLEQVEAFQIITTEPVSIKEKTIFIPSETEKRLINGAWQNCIGQFNLYLFIPEELPEIPIGTRLVIPNKLINTSSSNNPFGFDYAQFLARRNVFHQSFLSFDDIMILENDKIPELAWITKLRIHLTESIDKNVSDQTTASLIKATLLNDRTTMEDQLLEAYSHTGISHIIAISGMHVSILFGILLIILQWIKSAKLHWVKYLIAIPLVWIYIFLTSFPPSAVRAAIMFTLVAISIQTGQKRNSINTLAIAAFIMILYNPKWLYDVGVQLSFLAVLSIFIFNGKIKQLWNPKNKILLYLWEIIALSISVQILVFPLVIYYFNQFPLWVLLANIPAAIFSLVLMSGSLLIFALDALYIPCVWLGDLLIFITDIFHKIIFGLSKITPSIMQEFYLNNFQFLILNLAIILIAAALMLKKSTLTYYGLILLSILMIQFIYEDIRISSKQTIVVYNIANKSVIDIYQNKTHQTFSDKEISRKTETYNLFPARLGFRSIKKNKQKDSSEIWDINHHIILHLRSPLLFSEGHHFPIDYLIISNHCTFEPAKWKTIFNPQQVILDGSIPRWKASRWIKQLEEYDLPSYWVQDQGAWIFPGLD